MSDRGNMGGGMTVTHKSATPSGFAGPMPRKAGWLEKKRRQFMVRPRRCFCEAYDGCFVFSKSTTGDMNYSNQASVRIPLSPESTIESTKTVFNIDSGPSSTKYQFIAESEAVCREWVETLRLCAGFSKSPSSDEQFYKDDGPTIGIFVKAFLRWEEHQCVVVTTTLYPKSPVKDLMRIIRDTPSLGYPLVEQRLMFGRWVLDMNQTLDYYGIRADDVIVVVHNIPIITDAVSVTDILTRLGTLALALPSREIGCVGWSDRKQEHYHIYWARGQWASRAQPTLSMDQKREIRTSGSKSILAQNMELVTGSPQQPSNRIYLTDRDSNVSNLSSSPPQLSLSLSSRSPSLTSQHLGGRGSHNNPAVFHAGVLPTSLSHSRSPSPSPSSSPMPHTPRSLHTIEVLGSKVYNPEIEPRLSDSLVVPDRSRINSNPTFGIEPSTQHQEGITWRRGRIVGKGAWGTVYEALDIRTGALMAVKQVAFNLEDEEKQKKAQNLEREVATMMSLSHDNIVRILGSEIKDDKINILMEYVPGASLSTQLKQFGPFSEDFARKYTKQLVEALVYCHGSGVVHRDIKGANILVTLDGNPKLADFGSAKRLVDVEQKESLSEDFNYTTEWTAPEVFSQGEFNSKVDIWSLGCVIIEMITAQAPWAEHKFNSREQAMVFIGGRPDIPAVPQKLSAQGQEFLLRCLNRDPSARATAKELRDHPWIANVTVERPRRSGSSTLSDRPRSYVPPGEVVNAAGSLLPKAP